MKSTPPAHAHVVQLCADFFVQTLDGLRICCVKFVNVWRCGKVVSLFPRAFPLPMHTAVWPIREVVTRAFRKSGLSTRAGERPHLIIASLQHSTNSAWVGGLVRTVCPLPRHGRFPSALPPATRSTGVSAQPPTDIRLRFADAFASASKVFLSLAMRDRISACTSRKRFL